MTINYQTKRPEASSAVCAINSGHTGGRASSAIAPSMSLSTEETGTLSFAGLTSPRSSDLDVSDARLGDGITRSSLRVPKHRLLSHQEEIDLAREIRKNGPKSAAAAEELFDCNLRLAAAMANRFSGNGVDIEDLYQVACSKGLQKAVKRYNPDSGNRFGNYAALLMTQAIARCLCEQARTVRLPEHVVKLALKLLKLKASLTQTEPSNDDLAAIMGISVRKVEITLAAFQDPKSLDAKTNGEYGEGKSLYETDLMTDPNSNQEGAIFDADQHKLVKELTQGPLLTERQKLVIEHRFLNPAPKPLTEIGRILGITREAARQCQNAALKKLREKLKGLLRPGPSGQVDSN